MNDHNFETVPDYLVLNYHLMHPGGDSAPGDPNLAYFLNNTYHLHYILRHPWTGSSAPANDAGRAFSFIHITSPDMLHWTWQPTTLQPSFTGHGTFSGTGFVTNEGLPAAIYAGLSEPRHSFIAIAKDESLTQWGKPYALLPKDGPDDSDLKLLGDPDLFVIDNTYYIYSAGDNLELYRSTDLQNWKHVGPFMQHDMQDVAKGEDISCANFFPLGNKWMLLCISHFIGCRYYIGEWDSETEQFVPETHGRMNWRRSDQSLIEPTHRDFFAPESVLTGDGRRVMWAWLATTDPAIALKSVQSLPRELAIRDDGSLQIDPLKELESLRYDQIILKDVVLNSKTGFTSGSFHSSEKIANLEGDSLELRILIDRKEVDRKRLGLQFFADEENEGLLLLLRPESGTICLGDTEAPFRVSDLPHGENLDIRIFIDKYLVEVFVNGRQALLRTFMEYREAGNQLRGYVFGGTNNEDVTVLGRIDIWKMHATNLGFLEARQNRIWEPDLS